MESTSGQGWAQRQVQRLEVSFPVEQWLASGWTGPSCTQAPQREERPVALGELGRGEGRDCGGGKGYRAPLQRSSSSSGSSGGGGSTLLLPVMTLQVVLERARLGASVVTVRALVRALTCRRKQFGKAAVF